MCLVALNGQGKHFQVLYMVTRVLRIAQRPSRVFSARTVFTMNRPRNRQQRPPRQQDGPPKNDRSRPARPYAASVPNVQQVIPGASVSIVLKEDQPTGKENQGIVQDLLTRGNHPRGIKVRLTDGRVGRVQRMAGGATVAQPQTATAAVAATVNYRREGTRLPSVRDVRNEDDLSGPPPRTLFDFLPPEMNDDSSTETQTSSGNAAFSSATAHCPFCTFEGDELAVSHHVEEHLT